MALYLFASAYQDGAIDVRATHNGDEKSLLKEGSCIIMLDWILQRYLVKTVRNECGRPHSTAIVQALRISD